MNRVLMATGERVLDLIESLADELPPAVYQRALLHAEMFDQVREDIQDRVADLETERDELMSELSGCEKALAKMEDRS